MKKYDKDGSLIGFGLLMGLLLLIHLGVIDLKDLKAVAAGQMITFGGGHHKEKQAEQAKKPAEEVLKPSCRGQHHGPGCIAAKYVRDGRIRIPGSDDLYDYRVATGALHTPATRYTGDAGTVHYYAVNRPVWVSLVRMANSLNSKRCHKEKGKNHKKHRVCKTLPGAVTVTCLETCHYYHTSGGAISHHSVGEAVDVGAVRWRKKWYTIGTSFQYSHLGKRLMQKITMACLRTGAEQAISLLDFGYGSRSFALSDHYNHLHCGGYLWK